MQTVYVTRRNLLTLLSKLDRNAKGDASARTIIKRDTTHPKDPCSDVVWIVALEDAEYYTDRTPGPIHPDEEAKIG